ncbi:arf-GAP with Rho-GAP domain, ANK repeat and PH domain-containing protein 1-like isoform X4 [Hypanus sabinus]|uniref:arf-GAP with Rho-GAP domain, ANK repeat and PH domain-containing protein 1-like isoform X4 n=1 Tax=Hypanus sabinus TaxID=79690 RepID=UPI0028C410E3|nr:arf-GAP with Rho-GAP domain, ANK repeat and PH domain-containing protein 1-like isoform X4 [Hypanus sabinus]
MVVCVTAGPWTELASEGVCVCVSVHAPGAMTLEEGALSVQDWLRALHLDQYADMFAQHAYHHLADCWELSGEDLSRLGVCLPGHRKRILSALRKGPPSRNPLAAEATLDDVKEKPIPRKRSVYPYQAHPPAEKASLPPIPPRQGLGCPPKKIQPVPRPRIRPPLVGDGLRKDPPVLPPRQDTESRGRPPPLPARPLPRLQDRETSVDCGTTPKVNLDELKARHRSPPLLIPRAKLSLPHQSGTSCPPRLHFDLLKQYSAPSLITECEQRSPDDSLDLAAEMNSNDNAGQSPFSERDSAEESPSNFFSDEDNADDYEMMINLPHLCSSSDNLGLAKLQKDEAADEEESSPSKRPAAVPISSTPPSSRTMDTSQLCPLIKAGWLDKNPPQGSYIYQRRFVRLDTDYLRYFENEKEVYSKRVISVRSITRVSYVGEQKFEVVTSNRTFVFRAESDGERNEWVRVIQQTAEEKKERLESRATCTSDYFLRESISEFGEKYGYLELRASRNKVYVSIRGDKVWLYKNEEDHRLGIGITSVEMNVATVKETDRRGFDLTTPYRTFSFVADSDSEKDDWVEALRESTAEALSNYEVAEQIWGMEPNTVCVDCGIPKPEWASINLCVVMCKKCAGEHRALGPGISKVRSLKMDKKVWTEQLIQLFQHIGNRKANCFWAANVPPSEAISESSSNVERKQFISAKYREGKYRRYHLLFGNQEELDKALCAAVVTSDLEETMSLVFCGADTNCFTGDPAYPTPINLARQAKQELQVEFLMQNRNSETPRLELGNIDKQYYVVPQSITHNGFLYKTASVGKLITERKSKEEFSKRWCVLDSNVLSYYESDRNSTPNGAIDMRDVVCLSVNSPAAHGFEHTFEVFTDPERLFMFGTESAESIKEWVKSIAKSFLPPAVDLMDHDFERIGRLLYKDGLSLERAKVGWFALEKSTLFVWSEDSDKVEAINLRKLQELSEQADHGVLVLVEKRRTLYIQSERKLDFLGWAAAIQKAADSTGNTLSEQQLTDEDIPVLVDRCVAYITQYGLTSEGIYRKSGQKSKTTNLLELFLKNARGVRLREGEHQVDDVSNTLKRFFRESIRESIFTDNAYQDWLHTSMIPDEWMKVQQYQKLAANLPKVNRATLKALINHLYCVQKVSEKNQMTTHNLAIVFGPTLFQTDGQDNKVGRVVEDLISHFIELFNVDEHQLKRQLDEIVSIIRLRDAPLMQSGQNAGDFICTVYLEEKKEDCELSLKVPATMTAQELTNEVLYLRKLSTKEKDNWCCFEVIDREEMERPLHYTEKVLPILHSLGADSYMVVKKNPSLETMLMYLGSKVADQKHGMAKFREERKLGLGTGSFNDRYFMLTDGILRLFKEVRSNKPDKEWPVKSLRVYLGVKKKLKPPTCWGFTIIYENKERHERQQWYLCCDTQMEQREWLATFLYVQHNGIIWPSNSLSPWSARQPSESRLGNVSLIPLRGSANEMRNSVAAFAADPLSGPQDSGSRVAEQKERGSLLRSERE